MHFLFSEDSTILASSKRKSKKKKKSDDSMEIPKEKFPLGKEKALKIIQNLPTVTNKVLKSLDQSTECKNRTTNGTVKVNFTPIHPIKWHILNKGKKQGFQIKQEIKQEFHIKQEIKQEYDVKQETEKEINEGEVEFLANDQFSEEDQRGWHITQNLQTGFEPTKKTYFFDRIC